MPDPIFADPRLARLYDVLEADRSDLDAYVAMVEEFGAGTVLDVGCGTGELACLLARRGCTVVACDPAGASIDLARVKPGAERVRWVHGDVHALPPLAVDLAVMTGNVAQVFTGDDGLRAVLGRVAQAVRPGGVVVFETRDPSRRAWDAWNPDDSRAVTEVPGVGPVEEWAEVIDESLPLVTFRWTFRFLATGEHLVSDSTLRFRPRDEIEADIAAAGLGLREVRNAPDRPGLEWVFVCRRAG